MKMEKKKKRSKGNLETETTVEEAVLVEETVEVLAVAEVAVATEVPATEEVPTTDEVPSNKITDRLEIKQALQAIVFAAPKAMSLVRLRNLLNGFNYDTSELSEILQEIIDESQELGFQMVKVAGGYQYRSHPKQSDLLQKLLEDKPARLSQSALEVLAIISYKQPLTRSEIDSIRGVDSGHLLKGLLEKNLVRTGGHAETPGRPLLYETTPYFLEVFTMGSLDELPILEEFNRELQEGSEEGLALEGGDPAILAADPGFFDRESPLAAEPDRGSFDRQNEESVEKADFGPPTEAV